MISVALSKVIEAPAVSMACSGPRHQLWRAARSLHHPVAVHPVGTSEVPGPSESPVVQVDHDDGDAPSRLAFIIAEIPAAAGMARRWRSPCGGSMVQEVLRLLGINANLTLPIGSTTAGTAARSSTGA
jgi:hypothetical protein